MTDPAFIGSSHHGDKPISGYRTGGTFKPSGRNEGREEPRVVIPFDGNSGEYGTRDEDIYFKNIYSKRTDHNNGNGGGPNFPIWGGGRGNNNNNGGGSNKKPSDDYDNRRRNRNRRGSGEDSPTALNARRNKDESEIPVTPIGPGPVGGGGGGKGVPSVPKKEQPRGGGKGDDNNTSRRGSNSNPSTFYGFEESSSKVTTFSSNIKTGLLVNKNRDTNFYVSPLYISCGELFPPITVGSTKNRNFYSEIMLDNIYFQYYNVMIKQIPARYLRDFTQEDWYNHFRLVCKGLQIYYLYQSILSYSQSASNQNRGIRHLQERIGPQVLTELSKLKNVLSRLSIKKEVHDLIHYMYQNFSLTKEPDGPICRLSYHALISGDTGDKDFFSIGEEVNSIYRELNSVIISNVNSHYDKVFPEWTIQLKPCSGTPLYDENFVVFWNNQNVCYFDAPSDIHRYTKVVKRKSDEIIYSLVKDDVDGAFYALSNISLNEGTIEVPKYSNFTGIWEPLNKFDLIKEDRNKTSIQIYSASRILGCHDFQHAISANINAMCYIMEFGSDEFVELFTLLNTYKVAQTHNINQLTVCITEMLNVLLWPNDRTSRKGDFKSKG